MKRDGKSKGAFHRLWWGACVAVVAAMLAVPGIAFAAGSTLGSGALSGTGITWTVTDVGDPEDNDRACRLTLTGTGAIPNYLLSNDNRPWHAWYDRIVEVKVGDGITRVGNAAFTDLAYLDLIDLGNTVQTVGNHAFYTREMADCDIRLSKALKEVGTKAFYNSCTPNETFTFPSKLQAIGEKAFYNLGESSLSKVVLPKSIKKIGPRTIKRISEVSLQYKGTKKQLYKVKVTKAKNTALLKKRVTCSNGKTYFTLNFKSAKIKLKTSYTYNGKKRTPKVTVKNALGKKMKEGKDYLVKYSGKRKNIGKYKVTITPLDSGFFIDGSSRKVMFTIKPRTPKMKVYVEHPKYPPGAKDYITMSWKDKYYKKVEGYEIQWSTKKSFKSPKNVDAWNLEINYDFPKVKRGQTVYARMRAYKNTSNDVVYSKWTKIKHAKWK